MFHRSPAKRPDGFRHIRGDCGNSQDLKRAISEACPDAVIHMVVYYESHIAALEKALDDERMRAIILSSADVYKGYEIFTGMSSGPVQPVPFTEQSPLRDILYPCRGKLELEIAHDYEKLLVERAALQSLLLDAVVVRLGMVYREL